MKDAWKKAYGFKADADIVLAAKEKAKTEGRTLSNLVEFLLKNYLSKKPKTG